MAETNAEETTERTVKVHLEPKDPTLDRKLIISVAPTGGFLLKEHNPHQPITAEEIVTSVIESYREGASVWHVHARKADGTPSRDPAVIQELEDRVMEECPDILFSSNVRADMTKQGVDSIRPIVDGLMERGARSGKRYMHTAVIPPYNRPTQVNRTILKEVVKYLQERNIKPELQIHNYESIHHVQDWLIADGTLEKPYLNNLCMGFHGHDYSSPTGNPWGLFYMLTFLSQLPKDSITGLIVGGRNWLPLLTVALTQGVDTVRVGTEDTVWLYPHKDEKIRSCAQVVKKIAAIARELGREIATPAEARQILGV